MADALQSLVLLMVILSVAGTVAGGIYYCAVELPLQKPVTVPRDQPAPTNSNGYDRILPLTPSPGRT
jgi:hypothetical protein